MAYKVIITGATGMVGEGVMHECLQDPEIEEVLLINRRLSGFSHPKLKEVLHPDFLNFRHVPVDSSKFSGLHRNSGLFQTLQCLFLLPGRFIGGHEQTGLRETDLRADHTRG